MDLQSYRTAIAELPFGKRLPGAVYVMRRAEYGAPSGADTDEATLGPKLDALVERLTTKYEISAEFNVIKFRTDELKISFLSYPDFFTDAHPALRHAIAVDLVTGRARHTDYADNINPPILHRKESFIPVEHPRRVEFEALTKEEEKAGLYEDTTTIGFKLNWERLLAKKGLTIRGHHLEPQSCSLGCK